MSASFNEIGKKVMCLRVEMEEKGMVVGEIIRDNPQKPVEIKVKYYTIEYTFVKGHKINLPKHKVTSGNL